MTVEEYIKELQKLDSKRNITVLYDGYASLSPVPEVATEDDADEKLGIAPGDYIIRAY